MQVINKKEINSKDWKDFISWADEGKFLFSNINFLGGLFSINKEYTIEDSLIEFYLYNKFILKDRYVLDWPKWLLNKKTNTLESFIEELFKEFLDSEGIFQIYQEIVEYKKMQNKNSEREFELAFEYNKLIKELRENKVKGYNEWIIYINKHIHKDLKGIK